VNYRLESLKNKDDQATNTNIMKLSVIIPVYNEADTISEIVNRISKLDLDKEIIIVDDGSTDGTRVLLKKKFECQDGIKVIFHPHNCGKGAAVRTALNSVKGEIVVIQDADLEYSPDDYYKLIQPILDGKASVVYGSRFMNVHRWLWTWHWFQNRFLGKHYEIRYLSHFIAILSLNFIVRLLYGAVITDEATCYKVFQKDVIRKIEIKSKGFELCPEITAKVLKQGLKIYEVPISYHPRTTEQGKKITWKDGFQAIWTLIKYRFVD